MVGNPNVHLIAGPLESYSLLVSVSSGVSAAETIKWPTAWEALSCNCTMEVTSFFSCAAS